MVKALLFDLYDTLASIDINQYRATKAEMASKAGLDAEAFLKAWKKYTRPSALGEVLTLEERVARVMRDLGATHDPVIVRDVALLEYKLQTEQVRLADTVADTLKRLRAREFKIGLVTNTGLWTISVPRILGIEAFFDSMVFSFEVGVLKPDPRIYLAACERLEVRPFECIFTGDGNDRELDGARKLGMVTIKIGPGRDEQLRHEQSEAHDYRIEKLSEIENILDELQS